MNWLSALDRGHDPETMTLRAGGLSLRVRAHMRSRPGAYLARVYDEVAERGPLGVADLTTPGKRTAPASPRSRVDAASSGCTTWRNALVLGSSRRNRKEWP
jgi:hypothetical protein